jgi:hypothetical protein
MVWRMPRADADRMLSGGIDGLHTTPCSHKWLLSFCTSTMADHFQLRHHPSQMIGISRGLGGWKDSKTAGQPNSKTTSQGEITAQIETGFGP